VAVRRVEVDFGLGEGLSLDILTFNLRVNGELTEVEERVELAEGAV